MKPHFEVIDLFCGAGGTSTGILKAIQERMGRKAKLTAVNHWPTAVNSHTLNHPTVKHICETVENLHPLDLVKSGNLDLLAASCECRFHSNARGGGPCNEQSRSQPWQLVRWATDINVENILMENVREFMNWGPLNSRTKRPIKSKKGKYFKGFVNALMNLGYEVEFKVQVCANFGDPTSRPRLMLMARKGNAIVWPEPTHGPGRAQAWRTARECIDWELKGKSIFDRKKPLCKNTLRRIAAGLAKFGGANAEPFLVLLRGTSNSHLESSAHSLDEPLPTLCAGGTHVVMCEPFLVNMKGQSNAADIGKPMPAITAHAHHLYLCEPFIQHITHHGADAPRCHSLDKPMPTVTGAHRGEMALIEPFIISTGGPSGGQEPRSVDRPMGTVMCSDRKNLVQPLVVKYYKTGIAKPVDQPLDAITTKPRFALVEFKSGRSVAELDIRTRMLQPHELALAHSFPAGYRFTGNKEDQTKQIGNSVPVELAAAHAEAILS